MGTFNVIWYTETEIRLHFGEILITGCAESCKNDNFQCSQWWNFGKMTFLFQCNGRFSHILRVYFKKTHSIAGSSVSETLWRIWNEMECWVWGSLLYQVWLSRERTLSGRNMCTFLLQSGALWDMGVVHCGICATGLFVKRATGSQDWAGFDRMTWRSAVQRATAW